PARALAAARAWPEPHERGVSAELPRPRRAAGLVERPALGADGPQQHPPHAREPQTAHRERARGQGARRARHACTSPDRRQGLEAAENGHFRRWLKARMLKPGSKTIAAAAIAAALVTPAASHAA